MKEISAYLMKKKKNTSLFFYQTDLSFPKKAVHLLVGPIQLFLVSFLLFSCSNPFGLSPAEISGLSENSEPPPDIPILVPTLVVEKVYPINGAGWLKFISGSSGTNFYDRDDVACAGTETGSINACIHGGDKLKVVVTGYSSCDNLSMQDSLGVFIWSCLAGTGQVIFYSTGFNENKGMSDLIDFTGSDWLAMKVSFYESTVLKKQSASAKWWSNIANPIVILPDSSASMQTISGFSVGTILVLNSNHSSHGYAIDQDSVAIVIKPGSTLSLNAAVAQNCQWQIGEIGTPNAKTLFCIGNQKYLWIEGAINDPGHVSDPFIDFVDIKFSQLNKITVTQGADGNVLYSSNSNNNRFFNLKIQNSNGGWAGLDLYNSSYNYFYDIIMANSTAANYPFLVFNGGSDYNVFSKGTFSQSDDDTIVIYGDNNIVSDIVSTAASRVDVGGNKNTATHISTYAMDEAGVAIEPAFAGTASFNTVNQTLEVENAFGFWMLNSTNSLVSQTAVFTTFPHSPGYYLDTTSDNKFTYNLLMSSSVHANNCSVSGGSNQGLVDGTCANQGLSDAVKTNYDQMVVVSPMKAAIGVNDTLNASDDGSGTAVANTITDFLNFENRFRAWAKTGDVGRCAGTDTCIIVDLRLKATDTTFRNTSGNGLNQNAAFVAGATCPAAVHGNQSLTDQSDTPRTFLVNALEIIQDGLGNDNGLCESGEECIYSPNFGAYQGHGDYKAAGTCLFQNGTISNVKMYAYPMNGI